VQTREFPDTYHGTDYTCSTMISRFLTRREANRQIQHTVQEADLAENLPLYSREGTTCYKLSKHGSLLPTHSCELSNTMPITPDIVVHLNTKILDASINVGSARFSLPSLQTAHIIPSYQSLLAASQTSWTSQDQKLELPRNVLSSTPSSSQNLKSLVHLKGILVNTLKA
jgi:hypothetical protein